MNIFECNLLLIKNCVNISENYKKILSIIIILIINKINVNI